VRSRLWLLLALGLAASPPVRAQSPEATARFAAPSGRTHGIGREAYTAHLIVRNEGPRPLLVEVLGLELLTSEPGAGPARQPLRVERVRLLGERAGRRSTSVRVPPGAEREIEVQGPVTVRVAYHRAYHHEVVLRLGGVTEKLSGPRLYFRYPRPPRLRRR
jgi:hypothetical protein